MVYLPEEQALFITGSGDKTMKNWNVKTASEVKTLEWAHQFHSMHGLRPRGAGTRHGFRRHGEEEEVEREDGL